MTNSKDRLATAQWILERNLAWIGAADVKVGVLATLDVAVFGGLAAAYALPTKVHHPVWAWGAIVLSCGGLLYSLVCAFLVLMPRIKGATKRRGKAALPLPPAPRSLVFFGEINEQSCAQFTAALTTSSDEDLLADWARQIHRNAELAAEKHGKLRLAMAGTAFAIIPWLVAIVKLVADSSS